MTSRNLSTVAIDLIAAYGNTAKNVINAYRAGGDRVIGFMDRRWENALRKSSEKLTPEVRGNAQLAHNKFSSYYTKGVALATGSADVVVSKMVELSGKGVQQLSANANRFHKRTGLATLDTIASVAVPAAEAVSKLAGKIEHQSGLLAKRIAGTHLKSKTVPPRSAKPSGKLARSTAA